MRWLDVVYGMVAIVFAVGGTAMILLPQPRPTARESFPRLEPITNKASPSSYYRPKSCGPVSLYAICRSFKISTSLNELTTLSGATSNGVSIAGLVRAAEAKGLTARVWKDCDLRYLTSLDGPAIIDLPRGHYVAFFGWDADGKAILYDPGLAVRHLSRSELQDFWGKVVIEFDRPRNPESIRVN